MDTEIFVLGCLLLGIVLAVPIALIVLWVKVGRLERLATQIQNLERRVSQLQKGQSPDGQLSQEIWQPPAVAEVTVQTAMPATIAPASMAPETIASVPAAAAPAAILVPEVPVEVAVVDDAPQDPAPAPVAQIAPVSKAIAVPPSDAIDWEDWIGRRALGWVAVVVLLFATGFFLRYAFENGWVGPLGRVTMGILAGVALVADGWRRHRMGWRLFAQMLTAGGVVLLYLSMYGAFGFYHLLSQREAGIFLFVLVAESALLALTYEAPAIALMAVIGGLLTPLLMHSERDQYVSLFLYLTVLNAGVVWLLLRRAWPVIGTVALLGTQGLFWIWYNENYHPEKLAWALGFEAAVFGLYLLHSLLVNLLRGRNATWEDATRMLLNALLWCAAAYALLDDDYHRWLGTAAVAMAAVYALTARGMLRGDHRDVRLVLVAVAIAASFLATAFSLQTDTPWVALGWAAEAAVLWWFGVRILSRPLRVMAVIFAVLAVARVLFGDMPYIARPPFTLIFNDYALPALATAACLSLGLFSTRQRTRSLSSEETMLVGFAAIGCAMLPWYIVSVDLSAYFTMRSAGAPEGHDWHRLAQMSLSAWWSIYATVLLAIGFRARQAWLRWTGLGLFALTLFKVFLFDMADLDQIYRIVAFFVLAIVLGFAAWAYQRMQPERAQGESS